MTSEAFYRDCNLCVNHIAQAHPASVIVELSTGATCNDCLNSRHLTYFKSAGKPTTQEADKEGTSPSEKQVGGSHYKSFKIQPWHFCMVNGLDFATSSVIKYVCRKKGDTAKQIEDLKKAIHNIEMKIEMLESAQ